MPSSRRLVPAAETRANTLSGTCRFTAAGMAALPFRNAGPKVRAAWWSDNVFEALATRRPSGEQRHVRPFYTAPQRQRYIPHLLMGRP